MGQEARTVLRIGERAVEGKARLETNELVIRGDDGLRLKMRFKEMRSVEALDGELRVQFADGSAVFELGGHAEKWAQKIVNPKSLLDKLGVRAGMRVLVSGVGDEGFATDLRGRTEAVIVGEASYSARSFETSGRAGRGASGRAGRGGVAGTDAGAYDAVFVGVEGPGDLAQLARLKRAIKPDGAV